MGAGALCCYSMARLVDWVSCWPLPLSSLESGVREGAKEVLESAGDIFKRTIVIAILFYAFAFFCLGLGG